MSATNVLCRFNFKHSSREFFSLIKVDFFRFYSSQIGVKECVRIRKNSDISTPFRVFVSIRLKAWFLGSFFHNSFLMYVKLTKVSSSFYITYILIYNEFSQKKRFFTHFFMYFVLYLHCSCIFHYMSAFRFDTKKAIHIMCSVLVFAA